MPTAPANMTQAIVLWGPPTIDWLNVRHGQEGQVERGPQEVFLSAQPGGVALLYQLLDKMRVSKRTRIVVNETIRHLQEQLTAYQRGQGAPPSPLEKTFRHTWSLWDKHGTSKAYRMTPAGVTNWEREVPPNAAFKGWQGATAPRALLVLDDPGLSEDSWSECEADCAALKELVKSTAAHDVILRLDARSAERGGKPTDSALFKHIPDEIAERAIILTTVTSLRANEVRVGQSLSWERVFEDVSEAVDASMFKYRQSFKRVVITLGLTGAVLLDRTRTPYQYSLVFDRTRQEGDLEATYEGKVLGSSTCMLAALATAWEQGHWAGSLPAAIRRGVEMTRTLAKTGYLPSRRPVERQVLEFPVEKICEAYHQRALDDEHGDLQTFTRTEFDRRAADAQTWTILATRYTPTSDMKLDVAKRLVTEGISALKDVPIGQVEFWLSADRTEIEGVRSVQNAIREYRLNESLQQPLSIAVFGPPGSGKSFVVKQIAREMKIKESAELTINLSQYESAADLAKAFHRIQDIRLAGELPLVFWDEFDTSLDKQPLGWLRYFLAPMQDAKFADRGELHQVGRAIYIFAGGTHPSFRSFAADPTPEEAAAKKPDFVSRLRAYIDVKGPNPTHDQIDPSRDQGADDEFYMVRRAFLLRGSLRNNLNLKEKDGYKVDEGVLNAFLMTRRYRHGSRSLDSIVAASSLKGKAKYEVSSLPPEHLLEMHIADVKEFMKLARTTSEHS